MTKGCVYLIRCYKNSDIFYKIGRSTQIMRRTQNICNDFKFDKVDLLLYGYSDDYKVKELHFLRTIHQMGYGNPDVRFYIDSEFLELDRKGIEFVKKLFICSYGTDLNVEENFLDESEMKEVMKNKEII